VISKVSVRDHAGYMAWNAASKQGKLSVSVGRHQILVAGRDVAPEALIALAASIDLAKLARL
jgi:predicted transcriptional regulator